ncbi:MAG: hypothetical protein U1F42_06195 [Candidatus Competibacteraceae bacterium]
MSRSFLFHYDGQQREFGTAADAITFVTNYREDALRNGSFRKYEIIVRYSNNDKIDASFQDKEKTAGLSLVINSRTYFGLNRLSDIISE